ncbi:MAG: hypothetical protein Q9177_000802 [Variospora cf. flavescens]
MPILSLIDFVSATSQPANATSPLTSVVPGDTNSQVLIRHVAGASLCGQQSTAPEQLSTSTHVYTGSTAMPAAVPQLAVAHHGGLGAGVTLTQASVVVFMEPWGKPTDVEQAWKRCHRVGQTKTVMVYKIDCADRVKGAPAEEVLLNRGDLRSIFERGAFSVKGDVAKGNGDNEVEEINSFHCGVEPAGTFMLALPNDEARPQRQGAQVERAIVSSRLSETTLKKYWTKADERIQSEVKEPLLEEQTVAQLLCPPDSTREQEIQDKCATTTRLLFLQSEQIRKQLMCFAGRVVASAKEQEETRAALQAAAGYLLGELPLRGKLPQAIPFSKDDLYGALTLNSKTVIKIEDDNTQSVNDVAAEQTVNTEHGQFLENLSPDCSKGHLCMCEECNPDVLVEMRAGLLKELIASKKVKAAKGQVQAEADKIRPRVFEELKAE